MEGRSGSISISFPNDARLAITRQLAIVECWFTWGREEGKHRVSWFAHETRQDHIHRQTEASCTQRWRWFVIHHLACYYVASEKLRREVVWSVQGIWNYWRSPLRRLLPRTRFRVRVISNLVTVRISFSFLLCLFDSRQQAYISYIIAISCQESQPIWILFINKLIHEQSLAHVSTKTESRSSGTFSSLGEAHMTRRSSNNLFVSLMNWYYFLWIWHYFLSSSLIILVARTTWA